MMSFVLAHRRHVRVGQQHVHLERDMDFENRTYTLDIEEGGYVFQLERPVHVSVSEGRIRGQVQDPCVMAGPTFPRAQHEDIFLVVINHHQRRVQVVISDHVKNPWTVSE